MHIAAQTKKTSKALAALPVILIVAVVVFAATQIVNALGKQALADRLMEETWSTIERDDDSYYYLHLSFNESVIDYSGDFGFYLNDYPIATIGYKVTSPSTIEVYGRTIEVKFVDDEEVVFTPSFTDDSTFSIWFTKDWFSKNSV